MHFYYIPCVLHALHSNNKNNNNNNLPAQNKIFCNTVITYKSPWPCAAMSGKSKALSHIFLLQLS